MMRDRDSDYYERLQDEDEGLVLLIARHLGRDDLAVEERLTAWGQRACRKTWDALLIEISDILPGYRTTERFADGDSVREGRTFRIRLSREAIAEVPG